MKKSPGGKIEFPSAAEPTSFHRNTKRNTEYKAVSTRTPETCHSQNNPDRDMFSL